MIIGLTGTYASGKDTVIDYLKEKGFGAVSLSDVLREESKKAGRSLDRVALGLLAEELRREHGKAVLVEKALEAMRDGHYENFVVSSIRNTEEVHRLQKEAGFFMICVDAPSKVRYEREQGRGREQYTSFADFQAKEAHESSDNPYFMQLRACMDEANYVIQNEGTVEELKAKVDEVLEDAQSKLTG